MEKDYFCRLKFFVMKRIAFLFFGLLLAVLPLRGAYLLIPMDNTQTNHLKAYGVAYFVLEREVEISWLLNYRGGSYLIPYHDIFVKECKMRNVSYQVIADAQADAILAEIADPGANMDEMKLQKVPRVAVYAPKNNLPWDDAVTLVLTYAEIPYDVVYDDEVLQGVLPSYDWLHLHHEDFTGQYGPMGFPEGVTVEIGCGQKDYGVRGRGWLYVCHVFRSR